MEMSESDEETTKDESDDDDGDDVPDVSLGATAEEHSTNSRDVHAWCFRLSVITLIRMCMHHSKGAIVELYLYIIFILFALRDNIDFYLSVKDPYLCDITNDIDAQDFLPTREDVNIMKEEYCLFISR